MEMALDVPSSVSGRVVVLEPYSTSSGTNGRYAIGVARAGDNVEIYYVHLHCM